MTTQAAITTAGLTKHYPGVQYSIAEMFIGVGALGINI